MVVFTAAAILLRIVPWLVSRNLHSASFLAFSASSYSRLNACNFLAARFLSFFSFFLAFFCLLRSLRSSFVIWVLKLTMRSVVGGIQCKLSAWSKAAGGSKSVFNSGGAEGGVKSCLFGGSETVL